MNQFQVSNVEKVMLNQVEAIFEFATEAILITNQEGKIIRVNPSCERMFGYLSDELLGQPVEMLIPKRLKDKHVSQRYDYQSSPHARAMGANVELFARRKDDSEFSVEVSLSPYSNAAGSYVIAFIIDVTIRKRAEKQLMLYQSELEREVEERTLILKEAIQNLERIKDELDRSLVREREVNSMKSRFISIASHEFRTPLATILSSLSLVDKYASTGEEEKRKKHINRIKASVKNLTEILNDFLSLNKLEEGKVFLNIEKFDLREFVENIVQELQSIAKIGQKIAVACLTNGLCEVSLDKNLVRNILINLLSNAIKFSPENTVISVELALNEQEVNISVKDNGIGIPASDQKHLFERFFRSSNAGEIQGTGLGLSIVSHYVGLLKGQVTFASKENVGTTFVVQLKRFM